MRAIFTILGLVFVVAIVGVLAKRQLQAPLPAVSLPAQNGAPPPATPTTPKQQMDQLKQGLDQTLQQPRPMPGEEKK